jgi:hypothetical protein
MGKLRAQGRCRTEARYFLAHQKPPELPRPFQFETLLGDDGRRSFTIRRSEKY